MEQELRKFEGKAEIARDNPKRLYYKVMNKLGKDMKSICQIFYAVLPFVKTDLLAIPQDGTDRNYVDRWLENQKKTIREKCNVTKHVQKLLKAITDWNLPGCSLGKHSAVAFTLILEHMII